MYVMISILTTSIIFIDKSIYLMINIVHIIYYTDLKDTFAKYNMKCWRRDSMYEGKSKVIMIEEEEIEEPLKTTWKCPQCTLINPNQSSQCEVCEFAKPPEFGSIHIYH